MARRKLDQLNSGVSLGSLGIPPGNRLEALRLERLLGMEAQFWMNLQRAWDLYQAQQQVSAREIRKIKPLRRAAA